MADSKYVIGLDYGTNSVRALIVDVATGAEVSSFVWNYEHGEAGILLDKNDPELARQHPADYIKGIEVSIAGAMKAAKGGFDPKRVIGIGVDTTGSTPMPIDENGVALGMKPEFASDLGAMAWLWKDHTGYAEAEQFTQAAQKQRPEYLAKCGGRYSSEWFWSKILRCARAYPKAFDAAYTWVEIADWIPAVLAGTTHPSKLKRGICAAGHKAFYHKDWGGYPDAEFVGSLEPKLKRIRQSLPDKTYNVSEAAGSLTKEWATKLGLPQGIPIAIGAFDAHLGAVGSGIGDGTFVKIIGTSTCDIMVSSMKDKLADIPGLCGIVPESVLPGYYGLEAGQSAVGDIFNWFVNVVQPSVSQGGVEKKLGHEQLTEQASKMKPGQSGLLTLDWHNGNRTVLVDQRLSGLTLGMNLHTTPAQIYRSLIEATAYGARVIIERFEKYGVAVKRVVNCGGISARNPMAMQIYADVFNRPVMITPTLQTCALGSAIAAAVVAGPEKGGYASFDDAIPRMAGASGKTFTPIPANVAVYEKLFGLYKKLHDSFGIAGHKEDLSGVMKDLLNIRDAAR